MLLEASSTAQIASWGFGLPALFLIFSLLQKLLRAQDWGAFPPRRLPLKLKSRRQPDFKLILLTPPKKKETSRL